MKDLLAKLDALHAKATPGEWDYEPRGVSCDPADDVHTLKAADRNLSTGSKWEGTVLECDAQLITELVNHWHAVRAYIATLEENVEQARRIAALGKVNIHDWRVYTMSHADDCKCFGCSMVDEYERP
jgi:hypothetical protein